MTYALFAKTYRYLRYRTVPVRKLEKKSIKSFLLLFIHTYVGTYVGTDVRMYRTVYHKIIMYVPYPGTGTLYPNIKRKSILVLR